MSRVGLALDGFGNRRWISASVVAHRTTDAFSPASVNTASHGSLRDEPKPGVVHLLRDHQSVGGQQPEALEFRRDVLEAVHIIVVEEDHRLYSLGCRVMVSHRTEQEQ